MGYDQYCKLIISEIDKVLRADGGNTRREELMIVMSKPFFYGFAESWVRIHPHMLEPDEKIVYGVSFVVTGDRKSGFAITKVRGEVEG